VLLCEVLSPCVDDVDSLGVDRPAVELLDSLELDGDDAEDVDADDALDVDRPAVELVDELRR